MKRPIDTPAIQLTLDSRYRVRSLASREAVLETEGRFKGIVSIGSIDAIAMVLDEKDEHGENKMRVIPTHMVVAIDILEAVPKEEEAKDEGHMHYT